MLRPRIVFGLALSTLLATTLVLAGSSSSAAKPAASVAVRPLVAATALDASAPAQRVKLVFVHHSTGEAWLNDGHGGLGVALRNNNYFVSDTNYGWGPDGIGDRTDIGDWWTWFRGPSAGTYTAALYANSAQNCSYSRSGDPGGANEIVMFKSCFPNSDIGGGPYDPVPPIGSNPLKGNGMSDLTFANAKGVYTDLLQYFRNHREKLFVVVVQPPLREAETSSGRAYNARLLANWLVHDWLAGYPYRNVAVFDFYNVLTSNGGNADTNDLGASGGNHHRYRSGAIEDVHPVDNNYSAYPTGDSHPSAAGDQKASGEFVPLLNIAYHAWKADTGHPPGTAVLSTPAISGTPVCGVPFVLSGTITPVHSMGTTVTFELYSAGGGRVRPLRSFRAIVAPGSSSYRTKGMVLTPGQYVIRARHDEPTGGCVRSACRSFSVSPR